MERILVALDGSEHAEKALDLASDLAAKYDAEMILLHVLSERPLTDAERQLAETEYLDQMVGSSDLSSVLQARGDPRVVAQSVLQRYGPVVRRFREATGTRLLDQARQRAHERGARRVQSMLEDGDPTSAILRVAKELAVDTLVLGSRGLGEVRGLLMGSVSHKVAHLAACTCVTVR